MVVVPSILLFAFVLCTGSNKPKATAFWNWIRLSRNYFSTPWVFKHIILPVHFQKDKNEFPDSLRIANHNEIFKTISTNCLRLLYFSFDMMRWHLCTFQKSEQDKYEFLDNTYRRLKHSKPYLQILFNFCNSFQIWWGETFYPQADLSR